MRNPHSAIGNKAPIASSRLMNQCAFEHAARNLPLNDSMTLPRTVHADRDDVLISTQVNAAPVK